uniref:FERM domain-containing protein n=1 Tax=Gongylonema pulchrum TaxID=637853 RepID=A0A183EZ57_9BILA
LCRNFQTKDGGLLLNSFIALHQVEADHDRSMEDTWISLLSIGYNDRLDLVHVSIHNLLTLMIRTDAIFQSVRSHRSREREHLGQDLESYATCSQRWGILPKTLGDGRYFANEILFPNECGLERNRILNRYVKLLRASHCATVPYAKLNAYFKDGSKANQE